MCGVWCGSTQHVPVCPLNTSPCVRSNRARVYRYHAHMCFNMCAWCQHTRGRFECTQGHVLSGQTWRISHWYNTCFLLHFSSILTRCWVHLLSPIFCLLTFGHIWVTTCFTGSPKKPLDLTYFENGARTTHSMYCPTRRSIIESSALACCKKLIIRPHHTTPPNHPTNNQQRAAHDMTRHHTTKKHKDTHIHAHANVHAHVHVHDFVYVCVCACPFSSLLHHLPGADMCVAIALKSQYICR